MYAVRTSTDAFSREGSRTCTRSSKAVEGQEQLTGRLERKREMKELRDKVLQVRLTEAELEEVKRRAEEHGYTASTFARFVLKATLETKRPAPKQRKEG